MESRAKFAKLDKDAEISELPRDRHDRNDPAAILPPNDNDLFSQFGMAWMAITPQGNILDCNDFCLKLLGESLDVLKKSSIDDFIAPEFLDRVRERRKRRIRGEQVPNNHECRLKLASGTELWVRVRTSLLEGQEKTGGMMVILTDITDQKLAEAALHNKEQEYARLFASSQTGYVVSDADARILECNDLFLDFLGQNRDSLGTLSLWDFLAPECMADAKKRNALYLLGHEESLDYEIHCLRPDGSDVWLQVHSVPQYRDGELSVVESLMWDETDARNAQLEHTKESARAQKAADTLNAIFRSLPANVLLLDKTGSIVSMSDSWQELSSQQGQAILLDFKIGDNILELCDLAIGPGDENARLLSEGIRGILSLQQPRFDYRGNYFLAGEQRWYDMAVTPLIPGKREGAV
ncbi:MAG: PAS domain S-box protein, partial [Xanthomonadales bacterium]|nr:PAS domain S-box protein [Xanthomonadales bacterium]